MFEKRNVVIMFLLIMLSFAIISEVSAVSDAEARGTGSNLTIGFVDMANHGIAGERFDDGNMQDYDDFIDDSKSHNEQNPFSQSPNDFGDGKRNENLYEHKLNEKPDGDRHSDNGTGPDMFKPMPNGTKFDSFKPDDNRTGFGMFKGDANRSFDKKDNFKPDDLRDNKSVHVQNGELMDDVVSKLIGMKNITPNFKINQKIPLNDKNKSAPQGHDDKNSSDMMKDIPKKNPKVIKKASKNTKKAKDAKKISKKVKFNKKAKKTNKKLAKKSTKERAKL